MQEIGLLSKEEALRQGEKMCWNTGNIFFGANQREPCDIFGFKMVTDNYLGYSSVSKIMVMFILIVPPHSHFMNMIMDHKP